MKLVSIDVGLRNLAICVLEGTSRADMKIVFWEVIDVVGEHAGTGRQTCFQCKKAATRVSGSVYGCSVHAVNTTKASLNKLSLDELRARAGSTGTKAALVTRLFDAVRKWSKFSHNAKTTPVLEFAPLLKSCLDARAWWTNTDLVVIENQKDRRMFAVQAMLHMYFVEHTIPCRGVSAVYKLQNVQTPDPTATYAQRKKTGIKHCMTLYTDDWAQFFKTHKKKDDLADAFLQGVWYLEHPIRDVKHG